MFVKLELVERIYQHFSKQVLVNMILREIAVTLYFAKSKKNVISIKICHLNLRVCLTSSQQLKTEHISVQLPDDCPSGMKQVVAQI